ncbi:MAG: hypothetical protein J2P47_03810 [Acetobacteraceae bacterium]|nr:hypothetical protein [Acetobacteraceae bacterium]
MKIANGPARVLNFMRRISEVADREFPDITVPELHFALALFAQEWVTAARQALEAAAAAHSERTSKQ